MKPLALLPCILLTACAATKQTLPYTPPSVVPVRVGIEKLKPLVKPDGKAVVAELETALGTYQAQVDQQSLDLAKAQNDAAYWASKHNDALKKLWWWRGIALAAILAVVAYLGMKTAWRFWL